MSPERVLKSSFGRDVIVAMSVANLCFLWTWRHLVYASAPQRFLDPEFGWRDLLGAALDVLLLGGVFLLMFAASRQVRPWLRWPLRAAPFLFLLVQFRVSLTTLLTPYIEQAMEAVGRTGFLMRVGFVALALAGALWMMRHRMLAVRNFVLLMAGLFTLLTFARAGWGMARDLMGTASRAHHAAAGPPASVRGKRVVWLLFDELDYRLAFVDRPANVAMPEFDRLRAQSVSLENALPAAQRTMAAVPAMLTGLPVRRSRPTGETSMDLELQDGSRTPLTGQPDLFSRLVADGRASAVVGWYFPYCAVYGPVLQECHWESMQTPRPQATLADAMIRHSVQLLPWFRRISARTEYDGLLRAASEAVGHSEADLIYIHLSVPHAPPLYDAESGTRDLFILRRDWYEDNLRLADITLGALRRKMEAAGRWDDTTVIVTSDHQYRESDKYDGKKDPRMPVLVKLPHQQAAAAYGNEFHAEKMFGLAAALLEEPMETPEQLAGWLARGSPPAETAKE